MQTLNNVHEQFADFFSGKNFAPFAALLSKKLSEGHICLDLNELIGVPGFRRIYKQLSEIEKDLSGELFVSSSPENPQPFVLHNSQLYLHRYFVYESIILEKIQAFLLEERANYSQRVQLIKDQQNFIETLFPKEDLPDSLPVAEQINWQKIAVLLTVLNNFMIITGGPGTGKTFTVAKVLELLTRIDPAIKIGLAAPTGKAAMRLSETLKGDLQPGTIHRMLKTVYGTHHFKHNRDLPLDFDVIIIDEASMVDVALFAKLMDAIRPETRLILLGDKDQLASVEAGSMFRDLCQSSDGMNTVSEQTAGLLTSFMDGKEAELFHDYVSVGKSHILSDHLIELKRSRRFNSQLGIGKFSQAVIAGNSEGLLAYLNATDKSSAEGSQVTVDTGYSDELFRNWVALYADYINEDDIKLALVKFNRFRILCAVREGEHGLYQSNFRAEEILKKMGLIQPATEFYANRPVMLTRNNYELGLYNGDIGIIRPDGDGQMMLWFLDNDQLKAVPPARVEHIETVFAMTIHKSQGSEYESVLVLLPRNEESELLSRELLYTAVTRAKKAVLIQSGKAALLASVEKSVRRASGIQERLRSLS